MATLLGGCIAFAAIADLQRRAQNRCYRYAADQAARRDITDPAGRAYSDMATVIALDGKRAAS